MQTTIAHDIRGTLRLMRSQPVLSAAIVLMRASPFRRRRTSRASVRESLP